MKKYILIAVVLLAALTRIIPHPWNFTGVGALALFSGAFLEKRWQAVGLTWLAMFVGDLLLGFHATMPFTYGALALVTFLGRWNQSGALSLITQKSSYIYRFFSWLATSLVGSGIFFLVSNFGVWVTSGIYESNLAGLMECYLMGLPFLERQVLGDLIYLGAMLLVTGFAFNRSFIRARL